MKNKIIIVVLFVLLSQISKGQIKWSTTRDWRIYRLSPPNVFACSVDTLKNLKSVSLDSLAIHSFLQEAKLWPKEKYAAWMGAYLASYVDDSHHLRKCLISTYGRFFYDENTKRYYELPENVGDRWMNFIEKSVEKLSSFKF